MTSPRRTIQRRHIIPRMPYDSFAPPPDRIPIVRGNLCLISVMFAFTIGLLLGVFIPLAYLTARSPRPPSMRNLTLNQSYPSRTQPESESGSTVEGNIYWSEHVERLLPIGFHRNRHTIWTDYVRHAKAVKLEEGCGRMQNRLVTFADGKRACVRYRQNTDQIQGELFSFYLAQLLGVSNLVPSAITLIDLKKSQWKTLGAEISAAQWSANRPVVLTEFIEDLSPSSIPRVLRPIERHLNKNDIRNLTIADSADDLIELAQWSDLIIFDYLTANLDRVVNNLYNFQWNANIMDAPAHNLAKQDDLLVFLDNESGLLHGYRLLKKYEVYHAVLLDALCLFRRRTVDRVRALHEQGNVGKLLRTMFEEGNSVRVRDVLPALPEKSVKILNERLERVIAQIDRCQLTFGTL